MASDAVDQAVVARLRADAALLAAAPGGVHWDLAPDEAEAARPHVVIALVGAADVAEFSATAGETGRYLVKGVSREPAQAAAIAARVDVLLGGGVGAAPVSLTVSGFGSVVVSGSERVRYDEADGPIRWRHRGRIFDVAAWR